MSRTTDLRAVARTSDGLHADVRMPRMRPEGFAPPFVAYQATVLLLNYEREKRVAGNDPAISSLAKRRLSTRLHPHELGMLDSNQHSDVQSVADYRYPNPQFLFRMGW